MCEYDINSDQRRTTALKERIEELNREAEDLRAVITSICASPCSQVTMSVAQQLVGNSFDELHQAADLLRQHTNHIGRVAQLAPSSVVDATNVLMANQYRPSAPFPAQSTIQYHTNGQSTMAVSPISESARSSEMEYSPSRWELQQYMNNLPWSAA